ncbi:MAG: BMP family ABC transporter substrate-binding protein [Chloroflexi bacterium]|nr:BMP family ABC transporter substrate-binding protein [Chloroflexota bacterium]
MKPVKSLILILAIVLSGLSACIQSPDCFSEKVFCAALVTDTLGMDDFGANQDAWAGLQEARANKLADRIEYIESVDTRDYEKNISYFAKNGFDLIVTSGVGLRDETLRFANLYPDSVFVGVNQPFEESHPNLIPLTFSEDQIGFLAGALAARITKIKIVGAACENSGIDSMWRYCEGFRAGVKFTDKSIRTYVIYNDNGNSEKLFLDEDWGYQTGQTLIQRGADVIFAAGGVTGAGALRAASEARINAIGAERDQAAALGGSGSSVVTSILGSTSFEVQNLIRLLREGNVNSLGSGQIRFMPLNQKFPESLSQELNALLLQLLNGEIKTGVPPEQP